METEYRSIARAIGIIDMILSILTALLVSVIVFMLITTGVAVGTNLSGNSDLNQLTGVFLVFASFLTILLALICFLQIYASWKLILGSDQFVSAVDGLRACRIWRGITIFFLIIDMIVVFSWISGSQDASSGAWALVLLLLRVAALFFVQKHMNQLQLTLPTAVNGTSQPEVTYRMGSVSNPAPPAYYPGSNPISKHEK